MRLFLVAVPDGEDPKPRLVGRVEIVPPERYAHVVDEGAFTRWAASEGRVAECGHPTQAYTRAVRDRALREYLEHAVLPPPGVQIRQAEDVRLRVYPAQVHAGEVEDRLLWESPARVVRSRHEERRRRAKRRQRWTR